MAENPNNQDPSMEDILASIRKIIDRDEKKEAAEAQGGESVGEGTSGEVLDLTEVVDDNRSGEPPELTDVAEKTSRNPDIGEEGELNRAPEPARDGGEASAESTASPASGMDTDHEMACVQETEVPDENSAPHQSDSGYGSDVAEAVPEVVTDKSQEEPEETMSDDGLISSQARISAAAALGSLAKASDRDPLDGIPRGRPVEELVMEQLKPMLREWLDENLPTIVERIVEREVRYLSRRLENDDRT